jgi:hypothetical protein
MDNYAKYRKIYPWIPVWISRGTGVCFFRLFLGAFLRARKNRAIAAIPQPAYGGPPVFPLYPLRGKSNQRLLIKPMWLRIAPPYASKLKNAPRF